jgi:hypothetical protein
MIAYVLVAKRATYVFDGHLHNLIDECKSHDPKGLTRR